MNILASILGFTKKNNVACQSVLLLTIRLIFGFLFFQAGYGKIGNIEGVIGFFSSLGIPLPMFNAYFVAYLEMIGGILLLAGFASRLLAIPLSITMIVALLTAHLEELTSLSEIISTTPFPYLLALIVLISFGPGKFSVDYLLIKLSESGKKGWFFETFRYVRSGRKV